MKLTVKQLIIASGTGALGRLGKQGIKILGSYHALRAISRNIICIDQEIDKYNKDFQQILAELSGPLIKNCPHCKGLLQEVDWGIKPSDTRKFNLIIEEAQAVEVDIPIMTIALTEEIIGKADIQATDLAVLDWMLELPEEDK